MVRFNRRKPSFNINIRTIWLEFCNFNYVISSNIPRPKMFNTLFRINLNN